jgi:hypothetical protein
LKKTQKYGQIYLGTGQARVSSERVNTFTASIFLVFHQFSNVDREFNSMNIQRRNVSSERIPILFSNTTDLFFSVAVSKDFPQTILCHQI